MVSVRSPKSGLCKDSLDLIKQTSEITFIKSQAIFRAFAWWQAAGNDWQTDDNQIIAS
jgi:hypothetical protein